MGLVLVWAVALGAALLTLRLTRSASRRALALTGAGAVGFIIVHALVLQDSLWLARVLPFSNLIVIGNWALAGIGWCTAGDAALAAESAALAREYADQQRQHRAATRSLPAPR